MMVHVNTTLIQKQMYHFISHAHSAQLDLKKIIPEPLATVHVTQNYFPTSQSVLKKRSLEKKMFGSQVSMLVEATQRIII